MPSESEARARLQRMVAHDQVPELSPEEIDDLMALARRPGPSGVDPNSETEWAANMALAVGDYVVPPDRSGLRYLITVSDGLAGATEPAWPVSGASVVLDGVAYQGTDEGAWTPTYDLYFAAAEGWRWKAGKVASAFDFSTDQQSFDRSQIAKQCQAMIEYYEARAGTSIYGGGVETSGRTITSARMRRDNQHLVAGWRNRPLIAEVEGDDPDQAIVWIANS